jgi:hypothetical protein
MQQARGRLALSPASVTFRAGEGAMILQELWSAIRGKHGVSPRFIELADELEDDEPVASESSDEPPSRPLEAISGYTCIIAYRNAKGVASQRQITCIRMEQAAQTLYVRAYCHGRQQNRQFRLDRIEAVADVHTAEIVSDDPQYFFARFEVGHRQSSKIGWGLSVVQRADLLAGLNALVFVARCDQEWHPTERDEIERFVTSYWLRTEAPGEPPLPDILEHASRLSPDPEVFYVSLTRCHDRPALAPIIRRSIQRVIEADGRIHQKEFYWGSAIDAYFRSLEAST